jgi:uncharacterized protein YdiU (UPF0061 family)
LRRALVLLQNCLALSIYSIQETVFGILKKSRILSYLILCDNGIRFNLSKRLGLERRKEGAHKLLRKHKEIAEEIEEQLRTKMLHKETESKKGKN